MFLSWTALVFVIAAAAIAWFWQDSLAARERANAAAIDACERLGLQFLDGTVAFARIGWTRSDRGWLTLRRTYVFDYTATSIERLQGFVVLSGQRVDTVGYAPGESARRAVLQSAAPPPAAEPKELPGNVLQLDQWRAQRRPTAPPSREDREDRGDQRH
ncbi:MAG TPA: DUF3301 domain-containing protein [Povalibacter sp.]|uniref:DUF3301 domain-containing protein n=1 Tax=Povalibacter sp. TaxID=1962978 RepID=UPI002B9F3663|nr:DUF3301 domain-containing protein [Povalibacter sp.]HMN45563.1 DUF3301 domain-containing protein [Povalibacter sp.]